MIEPINIILILSNVLFLCLGFWAGRLTSNQVIPKIQSLGLIAKKPKSYLEDDPYHKAMADKPEERKETIA